MIAYIGLGSNLGDSFQYLQNAVTQLHQHDEICVTAVSPVYQSKPQGPQDQPDYLNAVVEIDTTLTAERLLKATQTIEQKNQRQRNGQHWGARTLDLDILLYGNHMINQQDLIVPHPWMHKRSFVLYPLRDIVTTLEFPNGKSLQACLKNNPDDDLIRIERQLVVRT